MAKYTDGAQWFAFPQCMNLAGILILDGVTTILLGEVVDEDMNPSRGIFCKEQPTQDPVLVPVQVSESCVDLELTDCIKVNEEIDSFMKERVDELLDRTERVDERLGSSDGEIEASDGGADPETDPGS